MKINTWIKWTWFRLLCGKADLPFYSRKVYPSQIYYKVGFGKLIWLLWSSEVVSKHLFGRFKCNWQFYLMITGTSGKLSGNNEIRPSPHRVFFRDVILFRLLRPDLNFSNSEIVRESFCVLMNKTVFYNISHFVVISMETHHVVVWLLALFQ